MPKVTKKVAKTKRFGVFEFPCRWAFGEGTVETTAQAESMALKEPEPQAFVDNLGDSSVNILVRVWAPAGEWWELKMALLNKLKLAIEAEGIEIPFPQRVLWKTSTSFSETS